MDKKFTIPAGGKVIIEINNPSAIQNPKSKIQNAKGIIRARREDDYSPRRLKPESYINIWDLSFRRNVGTLFYEPLVIEIEADYEFAPVVETDNVKFKYLLESQWESIENQLLAAGFETECKKLVYGETDNLYLDLIFYDEDGILPEKVCAIASDNSREYRHFDDLVVTPEWVTGGLKKPSIAGLNGLLISEVQFFEYFNTLGGDYFVTETFEYDELNAVVFDASAGITDIYLVPYINFEHPRQSITNDGTNETGVQIGNCIFTYVPREFQDIFVKASSSFVHFTPETTEEKEMVSDVLYNRVTNRAFVIKNTYDGLGDFTGYSLDVAGAAGWNSRLDMTPALDTDFLKNVLWKSERSMENYFDFDFDLTGRRKRARLCSVIKKNGTLFYVWRKNPDLPFGGFSPTYNLFNETEHSWTAE